MQLLKLKKACKKHSITAKQKEYYLKNIRLGTLWVGLTFLIKAVHMF